MRDDSKLIRVDIDYGARRRCRECGRLRSVRMFAIDLGHPDYRNPRCDDCESSDEW